MQMENHVFTLHTKLLYFLAAGGIPECFDPTDGSLHVLTIQTEYLHDLTIDGIPASFDYTDGIPA